MTKAKTPGSAPTVWLRAFVPAAVASMLCAGVIAAQTPRPITFDEAVKIALDRNATVRIAENTTNLDAVAVRQARQQFLPNANLSMSTGQSYGRSFSEAEGGIVNRTTNSVSTGISSSVTLFNGLANVANLREARLTESAGELDLERARQTVVFTVASNYLALVQQQEQLRVQRENLAAAEALEQQVQAYVDAGVRSVADLYQQQAAVASARVAVVEAERALELAKVDLMQTLQLDARETYEFVAPELNPDSATAVQYDLDALLRRAMAQRSDIRSETDRVGAAEQGVNAARASRWPSVSLSAGYNTNYSSANPFGFTEQLDQRRGGSIGIGVSIPLFDRGSTDAAAQRAHIQADNARISLESQRQAVGLEVRRGYLDYESAKARLSAAQAQDRAAELALQSSMERYQVGAATLVELAQAQATRVQAASGLVSARYNLLFQRTLLDYYVGDLDPRRG